MKKVLFFWTSVIFFFSCSNEMEENNFCDNENFAIQQETGIKKDIINYLTNVKFSKFPSRAMKDISISPFI